MEVRAEKKEEREGMSTQQYSYFFYPLPFCTRVQLLMTINITQSVYSLQQINMPCCVCDTISIGWSEQHGADLGCINARVPLMSQIHQSYRSEKLAWCPTIIEPAWWIYAQQLFLCYTDDAVSSTFNPWSCLCIENLPSWQCFQSPTINNSTMIWSWVVADTMIA